MWWSDYDNLHQMKRALNLKRQSNNFACRERPTCWYPPIYLYSDSTANACDGSFTCSGTKDGRVPIQTYGIDLFQPMYLCSVNIFVLFLFIFSVVSFMCVYEHFGTSQIFQGHARDSDGAYLKIIYFHIKFSVLAITTCADQSTLINKIKWQIDNSILFTIGDDVYSSLVSMSGRLDRRKCDYVKVWAMLCVAYPSVNLIYLIWISYM